MTPSNHGKPWTLDDDLDLQQAFKTCAGLRQVCTATGRTPYAVVTRLERLGLLILVSNGASSYYGAPPEIWVSFTQVNRLSKELE